MRAPRQCLGAIVRSVTRTGFMSSEHCLLNNQCLPLPINEKGSVTIVCVCATLSLKMYFYKHVDMEKNCWYSQNTLFSQIRNVPHKCFVNIKYIQLILNTENRSNFNWQVPQRMFLAYRKMSYPCSWSSLNLSSERIMSPSTGQIHPCYELKRHLTKLLFSTASVQIRNCLGMTPSAAVTLMGAQGSLHYMVLSIQK